MERHCTAFNDRAEFQGDYSQYQCGVKIRAVAIEDAGEWSCDIKEYNREARGQGVKVSKKFRVVVEVAKNDTINTTTQSTEDVYGNDTEGTGSY